MIWFKTKAESFAKGSPHDIYIARDIDPSGRKEYSSVRNYTELSAAIGKESSCLYEVIRGAWREMYDFDGRDLDITEEEVIQDFLRCRSRLSTERVFIKSASVPGKLSLHFILPESILSDYHAMQSRFDQLLEQGLHYAQYYDRSIYSKDRLIRTLRSDKCFSKRPFRAVTSLEDETLYFVSIPGTLAPTHTPAASSSILLRRYGLDTSFRLGSEFQPGLFRLNRIRPSMCIVCQRVHDSDNAWIDTHKMTYTCYRNHEKTISLESDLLPLSRARLVSHLRDFALSEADIDFVISRSKLF